MYLFRALGWGVVLYAVMFLLSRMLATYGYDEGILPLAASTVALIALSCIAIRSLRPHTMHDMIPHVVVWIFVAVLIDSILMVPVFGWEMFMAGSVWLGYAFLAIVPLICLRLRSWFQA